LPNGWVTNALCVHYLAYHRAQVPQRELDAVAMLPPGLQPPTDAEILTPEFRDPPEPTLIGDIETVFREMPEPDVVHWTYTLVLRNHASMAAHVKRAEVALSVDGVWAESERLDLRTVITPDEARRIERVAVFRLADFRRGRSAAIAVSLSTSSRLAVNWEVDGDWEDGDPLRCRVVAAVPDAAQ
jgi:hypothetical protein